MSIYILRRLLYTIPIWFGVMMITFLLFNMRDPISIAKVHMPQAPLPTLQGWVRANHFHIPLFLNLPSDAETEQADGRVHPEFAEKSIFYSQFFLGMRDMITFQLGHDKNMKPISESLAERIGPSLSIMLPSFVLSILISVVVSMFVAYYRESAADVSIVFITVMMMSIALPVYILAANFVFGKILKLVPIYNHIFLPVLIAVFSSVGGNIRFYRTVFLEQMEQDYVRTARAKGISEADVLFKHVLRNSLIPILTSVVMALPFLITGSLLLEQFFGIPGMGDMMYTAVVSQDFQVIKVMVYLGSFLYMLGSLLTDISYTIADPRVVFK
ncbi:MAG: ABC transporter permease [Spirochaetia bacterium]|nr:ABC transporter permease [Spirochaetia bacterium]